jgi:hypothetical protein
MLKAPEPAGFVIADISGRTSYLAGVELDHAQDPLARLLQMPRRTPSLPSRHRPAGSWR